MGKLQSISVISSGSIFVINFILKFSMRALSRNEFQETATKQNISIALKLTIARFINSALVLVVVNDDASDWYNRGNLVWDVNILLVLLAFTQPFMQALNIPGIVKWFKIRAEKAKGDECKLTQREANLLCEGSTIDAPNVISNFMNMIMTCVFYAPLIPHAIPLALISTFLCYWVTKYYMLRRFKQPEMFSELMATFFANFMPWIMLAWSLSFFFFLNMTIDDIDLRRSFKAGQTAKKMQNLIDENSRAVMAIGVVIAFVCVILPIRSCINRRINKKEALDNDNEYDSLALTFSTDYDKENPLTIKKGKLRLLQMQISRAEKDGNNDEIEMLKKQQEQVNTQTMAQSM